MPEYQDFINNMFDSLNPEEAKCWSIFYKKLKCRIKDKMIYSYCKIWDSYYYESFFFQVLYLDLKILEL